MDAVLLALFSAVAGAVIGEVIRRTFFRGPAPNLLLQVPGHAGFSGTGPFSKVGVQVRIENLGKGVAKNWRVKLMAHGDIHSRVGLVGEGVLREDGQQVIRWGALDENNIIGSIMPRAFRFEVEPSIEEDLIEVQYDLRADLMKPRTGVIRIFLTGSKPTFSVDAN
jgi:hypothetical protein